MSPTATTVGGYLRDLPADRRVAMARVCSMIRRSARGVRESMRYGLAFYELQGPLFALESTEKRMILFIAEPSVLENYKSLLTGVLEDRSAIEFISCFKLQLWRQKTCPGEKIYFHYGTARASIYSCHVECDYTCPSCPDCNFQFRFHPYG